MATARTRLFIDTSPRVAVDTKNDKEWGLKIEVTLALFHASLGEKLLKTTRSGSRGRRLVGPHALLFFEVERDSAALIDTII
jgi:hypothetical protein